MNTPKSNITYSKRLYPITQKIVKLPESLHLINNLRYKTADTFSLTFTTSLFTLLLLILHKSLKNLTYFKTCLITSKSGIFTCTFRNVSKISFSLSSFFSCMNLREKNTLNRLEHKIHKFELKPPDLTELE